MKIQIVFGVCSLLAAPFVLGACGMMSTKSAPAPVMDEKVMMEKWTAFMTPSDGHKALDAKIGNWNGVVKMWPAPGGPMTESTATSEQKWIMDGRYVDDHTEGTFSGMPFHGRGCTGYDNMKKKYVSSWIDSMGTGIMVGEGTYNASTKTFSYTSESPDVMTGKYVNSRMTEKLVDKDHWTMQMYGPGPDGKEFMMMQIDYTRAK